VSEVAVAFALPPHVFTGHSPKSLSTGLIKWKMAHLPDERSTLQGLAYASGIGEPPAHPCPATLTSPPPPPMP
jgi:hypothetical protein